MSSAHDIFCTRLDFHHGIYATGCVIKNSAENHSLIVITRPIAQATALAARLEALGEPVWVHPTLEIFPLADMSATQNALSRLYDYDLVIFVSPNAILQAWPYLTEPWPETTAIGVMGPGSVAALAAQEANLACQIITPNATLGDATGEAARFDSESLLHTLVQRQYDSLRVPLAQARVLVLRGTHGRDLVVEQLLAQGAQVEVVACYQRRQPELTRVQKMRWRKLAQQQRALRLLVTSSEGLRYLCDMVRMAVADEHDEKNANALTWFFSQAVLTAHPRIAEQAHHLGFIQIQHCAAGDDNIVAHIRHTHSL